MDYLNLVYIGFAWVSFGFEGFTWDYLQFIVFVGFAWGLFGFSQV